MKRYAAFAFARFYPYGGMDDFRGAFDSVDQAKAAVDAHHAKKDTYSPEGHVADMQTQKIVCWFDEDGWRDGDPNEALVNERPTDPRRS